jgi:Domain of unknown function (DUF1929)
MGTLARMWVAMVAVIAFAGLPAAACAHPGGAGPSEQALFEAEAAALGADHAREHELQREALRQWLAKPAAERSRLERQASRETAEAATRIAAALDPADQVGRWENDLIDFPTWALNSVVMPTGDVMFWGRAPAGSTGARENVTEIWIWNPKSGRLDQVPAPQADIDGDGDLDHVPFFCSGQSLLPSGEVLLTGGNLAYPTGAPAGAPGADFAGLNTIYTLDPWTRRWTEQPRMRQGRWYPTQVELADGRTVVVAGYDENGAGIWNQDLEVFTPAAGREGRGRLTLHQPGTIDTGSYPHLFALPDGKVLLAGHEHDVDSAQAALLDPARLDTGTVGSAWSPIGRIPWWAKASQAALLFGEWGSTPHVTVIGGYGEYETPEDQITAVSNAATLEVGQTTWTDPLVPDQNVGRAYANLVELPDGMLVTVGGGSGIGAVDGQNETDGKPELKQVELFHPGVDSGWRLGPPQRKWRTYHSTAVLLPDGRVLSAGDDYWSVNDVPDPGTPLDKAEIYSPPYLFDGEALAPRPAITSLPPMGATGGVLYGERFGVGVTGAQPVDKAVLIAPAATTHGVNMNQRRLELEVLTRQPGGLEVRAPSSATLAPPGWYMLFVFDSTGTPSEAGWVWLRTDRPAPTTPVVDGPVSTPDRTAPTVRARILRLTKRGRNLRVRVKASERSTVRLHGRIGGRRLKARTVSLRSGVARTVYLRIPGRAVTALRTGGRLRASVAVAARDGAGNIARRRVSTRVRLPTGT